MDKLKIVKIVVALLTFLIIFGTLLLFTVVYRRTRVLPPASPAQVSLNQPAGTRVERFSSDGDRLTLLLSGGGRADRLLIYSLPAAAVVAEIRLN